MEQEALDRLQLLIDSSHRCKCGGDCELLKTLAAELMEIQVREIGFQVQCPSCNESLSFDPTGALPLYKCKRCDKWFRYDPGTVPVEIETKRNRELLTDWL
jgi:transposase-like protein